ncbi:hypothetical protein D9M69_451320 [compost metagenome]
MMAFYETYTALVSQLRETHPSGAELTDAQHELLGSATAHLSLLQLHCSEAGRVAELAEDLLQLLENPKRLKQLLNGEQPGGALFMSGIEQVVNFAANAASLLTRSEQVSA